MNLAASLVIMPDPQANLKIAEYLYAGSDLSRALDPLVHLSGLYMRESEIL